MKKSIKKAFTLAEIIFVMGIIGIVATLTVTNAKRDTDVAEKVTQLRKTEEILSTAFAQAVTENGSISTWGANGGEPTSANVWEVITPYLKLKKDCETSTGCWQSGNVKMVPYATTKFTGGGDSISIDGESEAYKGVLANGASLAIVDDSFDWESSPYCGYIYVDVNGTKGTYRYGDDVFAFVVNKSTGEIFPNGSYNAEQHFEGDCLKNGSYCTAWVFQFGNQDYLKDCRNKLKWGGPQTCR